MKPARKFTQVSRRFYRPECYHCPVCQKRLRRAVTLSERTVVTLKEVIKLVHAGYRCPDPACAGHQRTYRSAQADALALPWFTYGVDVVLLVGQLRLQNHQTVDEIHQELLKRLTPLGVNVSRPNSWPNWSSISWPRKRLKRLLALIIASCLHFGETHILDLTQVC